MKAVTVETPPVIVEGQRAFFVEVIFDAPDGQKYCVRAPIGDGRQFASRVWQQVIGPALLSNEVTRKAQGLIDALQDEAANHGGLRIQPSLRLENELRLAINKRARA